MKSIYDFELYLTHIKERMRKMQSVIGSSAAIFIVETAKVNKKNLVDADAGHHDIEEQLLVMTLYPQVCPFS